MLSDPVQLALIHLLTKVTLVLQKIHSEVHQKKKIPQMCFIIIHQSRRTHSVLSRIGLEMEKEKKTRALGGAVI